MQQSLPFLLLLLLLPYTAAHSWVECTDYKVRSKADTEYYAPAQCKGFPRCGSTQASAGFGKDTGFDYRPKNGVACQCNRNSHSNYSKDAPAATYTAGQRVCLAYPSKNHVADSCTNVYIPDEGLIITRSYVNSEADPELRHWPVEYDHLNGKHEVGSVDYKGFQNCPKFCENPDKSLCTVCFDLEKDLKVGRYTFSWEWNFNTMEDTYTTCWEANVVA